MLLCSATPEDFDCLDLRDQEKKSLACDPNGITKVKDLITQSRTLSMVHEKKLLAILGFISLVPGVYRVWIFPSIHVSDYAALYLRTVKKLVLGMTTELHGHRFETLAIDDKLHDDWMTFLGFHKEGKLEKYTADMVDYNQWSIIINE